MYCSPQRAPLSCALAPRRAHTKTRTTIEVAVVSLSSSQRPESRVREWPPDLIVTCLKRQLDNLDHTMIGYRRPPLFTHEHGCVKSIGAWAAPHAHHDALKMRTFICGAPRSSSHMMHHVIAPHMWRPAHMMPTYAAHLAPLQALLQASSHLSPLAPSACSPLFYLMLSATSRRPR